MKYRPCRTFCMVAQSCLGGSCGNSLVCHCPPKGQISLATPAPKEWHDSLSANRYGASHIGSPLALVLERIQQEAKQLEELVLNSDKPYYHILTKLPVAPKLAPCRRIWILPTSQPYMRAHRALIVARRRVIPAKV